ncbi:COR domain-containing protein [Actinomycetes bacterium KLBMP 9797]
MDGRLDPDSLLRRLFKRLGSPKVGVGDTGPEWDRIPDGTTHTRRDQRQGGIPTVRPAPYAESLDGTRQFTEADLQQARRDGYIRFSGWGLKSLPDEISQLGDLERLYLVHNELTQLPSGIGHLLHLTELDVRNNKLVVLPSEIGLLENLEELYLDENLLESLPPEIGSLNNLRTLDLDSNRLERLPPEICLLRNLEQLDLRNNRLVELPQGIGRLTNLRRLYLTNNQISRLPREIGHLTRLEKLDVDGNNLAQLPRELMQLLTRPITISVDRNPLGDPLPELVQRGWGAVYSYMRSLEDAVPQYEAKVLIVGEGNVGKTSLLAALRGEQFVVNRETTHGLEIHKLPLKHPDLDLEMIIRAWDFGGQEVYRVTHQFFFSRRALYVLVWNARDGQEQNEVESWLRRIRLRVGPEARAILVSTHCDERHPELDYPQLDRMFPGMLAGQFSVDNRSANGISALRAAIARETASLPQMGRMLSPRWISARDQVLSRYQQEPQIRYDEFIAACERNALHDDEAVTLAELLHDLGQIIYYGDDDGLRDIVVLNPEWLTKAIAYVLEDGPTRRAQGVLTHHRLHEIWRDRLPGGYDRRYYPYFLRLMEKFDICYRLEDQRELSLVAQLVPHPKPSLPWMPTTPLAANTSRLTVICKLSEPAPGLISWLTVRHHQASIGKHWRNGVFLRHPVSAYASEALIELDGERRLLIEVRAPSPNMFFSVLVDSVEHLLRLRWPGLRYRLVVPCPTPGCSASSRSTGSSAGDTLNARLGIAWNVTMSSLSASC